MFTKSLCLIVNAPLLIQYGIVYCTALLSLGLGTQTLPYMEAIGCLEEGSLSIRLSCVRVWYQNYLLLDIQHLYENSL